MLSTLKLTQKLVRAFEWSFHLPYLWRNFHKVFNPTKVEGTCDNCQGQDFYQREDDKPETVKRRLDVNIAQGEPIIEFYRSKDSYMTSKGTKISMMYFQTLKRSCQI